MDICLLLSGKLDKSNVYSALANHMALPKTCPITPKLYSINNFAIDIQKLMHIVPTTIKGVTNVTYTLYHGTRALGGLWILYSIA